MGRMYVSSTPATRGEVEGDQVGEVNAESGLSFEQLEEAAAAAGYRLIPVEVEEPKGNASREEWANFAKSKGASDEDLLDEDGEELGRDALREKYQTPPPSGD
jgi:hypothetical protein